MKWLILLVSSLAIVYSRPQSQESLQNAKPSIEFIPFPNGLRFPKWLPNPDHQLQYFGTHHPFTIEPKNKRFLPQLDGKTITFYSLPKYQRNTQPVPELNKENMKVKPVKLSNSIIHSNLLLDVISKINQKPVLTAAKEKLKVDNLLSQNIQYEQPDIMYQNSLAPYRAHPLLHYIKNRDTIQTDKIISFRNPDRLNNGITTLILKPVARSIAGVDGKAIAMPLSRAILRKGTNVDILFEPEAVAIAGPGGVAHAESDLEISYEDMV